MSEQSSARQWRAQPLFISSTFRDMQAERDHLHEEVFPALEEWLRGYRTLLEPLDLRWGVETSSEAEAEDKEQLVLKVCLDGIVECRPYLIVLLGDRYGWQPSPERLADTAMEHGFSAEEVDGMSVTALEIEAGVLGDDHQAPRSLVYLREPLPYHEMPEALRPIYSDAEAGNDEATQRLAALKDSLRADARVNRVRDYALGWDSVRQSPTTESLRAWGEQVLADLKAMLASDVEAHAAQTGELTWQAEEAFELEAFVEHRARTFVGREATIRDAEALAFAADADDSSWAALYTGDAGAGKSALIAELYRRWQPGGDAGRSRQDTVVLAHAAGISPRSSRITPMLQRWVGELAAIQDIESPISDDEDHEAVVDAFLDLVTAVARHRRVVLLIDAINQFEAGAWQDQSWVPAARANIRLIATAIPGTASERLLAAHQGIQSRELPALQADEAGEIAAAMCARYRKTLANTVLEALKRHPSAGNALWLRMAIDELLLLDADDFEQARQHYSDRPADVQIPAYMEHLVTDVFPRDVPGLYGYLLSQLEERFGTETVRAFALAIALSRSGWREQGLGALVRRLGGSWDDAVGANLRRAFRLHLIRHGDPAAWDFFHAIAREAVLARYPASEEERQAQHVAIAGYLGSLPDDDPIAARERMHHLIEADAVPAAAEYYVSVDNDHPAHAPSTESIAVRIIEGEASAGENPGILLVQRMLDEAGRAPEEWLKLPNKLMFYVFEWVRGAVAETTVRDLMACIEKWLSDSRPAKASDLYLKELAASRQNLGDLEFSTGNPNVARSHYEDVLAINNDLLARTASGDAERAISFCLSQAGDLERSEGNPKAARLYSEEALAIKRDLHARFDNAVTARDLSCSHSQLADIESSAGNPKKANSHAQKALAIDLDLHARDGSADTARNLSVSHSNLGDQARWAGNMELARSHCEQAFAIAQNLHERYNSARAARDIAGCHNLLGDVMKSAGKSGTARWHFKQAHSIFQDLHARIGSVDSTLRLALSRQKLGALEESLGNIKSARLYYKSAVSLSHNLRRRVGVDSAEAAHSLAQNQLLLGVLEREAGHPRLARTHLEKSHELFQVLHKRIDNAESAHDLGVSHGRLAGLEGQAGNLEGAISHYELGLGIAKDMHTRINNARTAMNLRGVHTALVDLKLSAGDMGSARSHCEQALAIAQALHATADSSDSARELAISHASCGDLERTAGHIGVARSHYLKAADLLTDLHKRVSSVDSERNLAISRQRLGDIEGALGNSEAACGNYQAGLAILQKLAKQNPANAEFQELLAATHASFGLTLWSTGNYGASGKQFEASEQLLRVLVAHESRQELYRSWMGSVQHCVHYLLRIGRPHLAGRLANWLLDKVGSQPEKKKLKKLADMRLVQRDTVASPAAGITASEILIAVLLVQWSVFFWVVSAPLLLDAGLSLRTQIRHAWRRFRYRKVDVSNLKSLADKLEAG